MAISAVVKSKDGEPKTGLTKDDFVLKQDGREVPIRYFSQGSELPLSFALMVDTSGSQHGPSASRRSPSSKRGTAPVDGVAFEGLRDPDA